MSEAAEIDFDTWRAGFLQALHEDGDMDVPCRGCTACCRSSQFILIEPDETETLDRIDDRLLAPAPGRRDGARVLGFDLTGNCPMLDDHGCGIYAHRPRTCRTYDCRVFAAAGVAPEQPLIAARTREWRFGPSLSRPLITSLAAEHLAGGEDPRRAAILALAGEAGTYLTSAAMAERTPLTNRPDSSVE